MGKAVVPFSSRRTFPEIAANSTKKCVTEPVPVGSPSKEGWQGHCRENGWPGSVAGGVEADGRIRRAAGVIVSATPYGPKDVRPGNAAPSLAQPYPACASNSVPSVYVICWRMMNRISCGKLPDDVVFVGIDSLGMPRA